LTPRLVPWLVRCSFNEEATLAAETKPRFSRPIRKCGGPDSTENQIVAWDAGRPPEKTPRAKSIDPLKKW